MKTNLSSFVSYLEIEVATKKDRTLIRRIFGWLKLLFKALASIIVTLGPLLSPFLYAVAPGACEVATYVSTLWRAAAALPSEPHEGKESKSIESVLQFLKKTVPKEAETAQKRLERFDKAVLVMGLDVHMKTGRRVGIRGSNPAAVAGEWRDAAKQYQSELSKEAGLDF